MIHLMWIILNSFHKNNPIFNHADYETAQVLLVEIKDIFQKHLKPSNSNVTNQSAAIDIISKFGKGSWKTRRCNKK
jgi:hypothetical protein